MKKPHHGEPIRGNGNTGYLDTLPSSIVSELATEANGINHGSVTMSLFFRDGKLHRYTIGREKSNFAYAEADGKGVKHGT